MIDFNTIYDTYAQQVFRICMGYANDTEKAKDLVQETFISGWRNLASFRNQSKISTWIFRIATNHCLRAMEVSRRMPIDKLPAQLVEPQAGDSMEEKLALPSSYQISFKDLMGLGIALEFMALVLNKQCIQQRFAITNKNDWHHTIPKMINCFILTDVFIK